MKGMNEKKCNATQNNTFHLLAFVVNEYIVYIGLGKHVLHFIKTFYLIAVETNQILVAQLCLLHCLCKLGLLWALSLIKWEK